MKLTRNYCEQTSYNYFNSIESWRANASDDNFTKAPDDRVNPICLIRAGKHFTLTDTVKRGSLYPNVFAIRRFQLHAIKRAALHLYHFSVARWVARLNTLRTYSTNATVGPPWNNDSRIFALLDQPGNAISARSDINIAGISLSILERVARDWCDGDR